jgi:hypothetical protein
MDPLSQLRMLAWFEGLTEEMPVIHYKLSPQKQRDLQAFLDAENPGWRATVPQSTGNVTSSVLVKNNQ